jgi:RHS repeat-associated protein
MKEDGRLSMVPIAEAIGVFFIVCNKWCQFIFPINKWCQFIFPINGVSSFFGVFRLGGGQGGENRTDIAPRSSANGDRFLFAGMQYVSTTSLYFENARWYVPGSGRFSTLDPTSFRAGDANLYRYVGNGPTLATDPTGMQRENGDTLNIDKSQRLPRPTEARPLSSALAPGN